MNQPALDLRDRQAVVFGGAGFIGSHLVASLTAAGASVAIADLQVPDRLPAGARFERVDVREPIEVESPGDDPLVFNLAAVHRTPGHPDHEYFETNVAGARNVTEFCARNGASSLLFTSSISVYGPTEEPRTETSPLTPTSAYGKSKLEAEEIHRQWAEEGAGRRLVVVRPAAVFGPGENGNFTRLARGLRKGFFLYPGRKDTLKACGYVDDLIGSLYFMWATADPVVTYNYAYPEPPTLEAICAAFHEVGGLPGPRGTIPTAPMLAVARLLSAVGLKTFDPDRVRKLVASTNIQARELNERGFPYETDLRSAIARWRAADPPEQFV
ncbi:MAG TPA: NAD(P)-dependent oxidoreductase [Solirubrobacterales bacterium]